MKCYYLKVLIGWYQKDTKKYLNNFDLKYYGKRIN